MTFLLLVGVFHMPERGVYGQKDEFFYDYAYLVRYEKCYTALQLISS